MSDINLSAGVRQNLGALQNTADLLSRTQERLSTGNRVNSALDDPNAFFTAAALNDRAADLSTLLDAQGQAIQVVEAADQGISAITDLVQSARAVANQALQTDDATERADFAAQFDDLLTQIQDLAGDASFNGTNLLEGDALQVVFNEDNTSNLTVSGVDFTNAETGLGLNVQSGAVAGNVDSALAFADLTGLADGDTVTISDGTTSTTFTVDAALGANATLEADDLALSQTADGDPLGDITISAAGAITSSAGNLSVSINGTEVANTTADSANNAGTAFDAGTGGDFATNDRINAALSAVDSALSTLRSTATSLGTNLSTIQIRSDFTESLINTLQTGAGNLTLADTNEEGANLLTLQTRQQLASTSLSFATQADQSVLSLF